MVQALKLVIGHWGTQQSWESLVNSHWSLVNKVQAEKGKRMKLEELKVYNMAMELSELVWDAVKGWEFFANTRSIYMVRRFPKFLFIVHVSRAATEV